MGSNFSWIGSSGSFAVAKNWKDLTTPSKTGLLIPGTADTADFSTSVTAGADITGSGSVSSLTIEGTIAFDASITAGSITNAGTLTVRSGNLTAANTLVNSKRLTMAGGTVSAAYVTDTGQMELTGGTLAVSGFVGDSGTLTVAGPAVMNDTGGFAVGDAAAGGLTVSAGGTINAGYAIIGNQTGVTGTATVGGTGAAWITSGSLIIGNGGDGTLAVNNGGRVSAQLLELAAVAGLTGSVTVSGSAASVAATQVVDVGYAGTATMSVQNGATLSDVGLGEAGALAGSNGTVTVTGTGSTWTVGTSLLVGNAGTGTVSVTSHGTATAQDLAVGYLAGSNGTLKVDGAGSLVNIAHTVNIGSSGTGTLDVTNGGTLVAGTIAQLGAAAGITGSATIDGAGSLLHDLGTFNVGVSGTGALTVRNQGTLTAATLVLAAAAGSQGSVTVTDAGSLLSAASGLYVGGSATAAGGTGTLGVAAGGVVSTAAAEIWNSGVVTLTQASLLATTMTVLGTVGGSGTLTATSQITNNGTLNAGGGTLTVTGGIAGTGLLGIAAGATLLLGGPVAATQTIAFASSGAPGTLALASPLQVLAPIQGFANGDTIELVGITAAQLQYANGVLTATGPGGTVASLSLAGSYALSSFSLTQDGQGDSLISATTLGTTASVYLETHAFFSASSPWNTPIAKGATYTPVAGLAALDGGLTSWTGGNVAIYYAQPTDPLVPILYNPNTWYDLYTGAWKQSGNSAAVEQQILASSSATNPIPGNPYSTQTAGLYWNSTPSGLPASYDAWTQAPGQTLYAYVPAGALPPDNSDGQTVIIQPDGMALEALQPRRSFNGSMGFGNVQRNQRIVWPRRGRRKRAPGLDDRKLRRRGAGYRCHRGDDRPRPRNHRARIDADAGVHRPGTGVRQQFIRLFRNPADGRSPRIAVLAQSVEPRSANRLRPGTGKSGTELRHVRGRSRRRRGQRVDPERPDLAGTGELEFGGAAGSERHRSCGPACELTEEARPGLCPGAAVACSAPPARRPSGPWNPLPCPWPCSLPDARAWALPAPPWALYMFPV